MFSFNCSLSLSLSCDNVTMCRKFEVQCVFPREGKSLKFIFFSIANFLVSHFWFFMALIGHCDSLSLRFFCQTSATGIGRFWADGILFFSALAYFTNPALIIFHRPLSLHQIYSPPTIQFSIDCLPWLYCTTLLNLYLPTDLYNLEPTNCCIPIFTYKFTYLQIATLYLWIHLLIPTNCCIPIRTTLYLWIYLQKVTYQFI